MALELQPKAKRERVTDPNRFDMITHETDARGRVRGTNLLRIHMKDGNSYYERPVGSGNLFYENNEPAGRVEAKKDARGRIVGKTFDFNAKHVVFKKPADAQTELEQKLMEEQAKSSALEKELAAIRAEDAAKVGTTHMVGDEIHRTANGPVGGTSGGVSRSAKDAPLAARLTEPKSSSTPVNPDSGHAVPVMPTAEAIRVQEAGKNAEQKQDAAAPKQQESDGQAHAPRPGPTPNAVHAKQAAAEPPRPSTGPGSGPTPANVHADRAREEAKGKL